MDADDKSIPGDSREASTLDFGIVEGVARSASTLGRVVRRQYHRRSATASRLRPGRSKSSRVMMRTKEAQLQKWEYKIFRSERPDDEDEALLTNLGGEGWELVTVFVNKKSSTANEWIYFMKRARAE